MTTSSATGELSTARAPSQSIPALTSLRFFAALAVVLFHYGQPTLATHAGPLRNAVKQGCLGVGFFYVLSGFILVHAHPKPELDNRRFWRKRAARILPAYLLAMVLSAPPVVLHHLHASGPVLGSVKIAIAAVVNLLLLEAWLPFASSAWNSPAWSVSVEAFFYVTFPWLLPWVKRRSAGQAAVAFVLSAVATLIVPSIVLFLSRNGVAGIRETFSGWHGLPLLHAPAFIAGMCARRMIDAPNVRERLARHSGLLLPCALALVGVTLCIDWSAIEPLPALHMHLPVWALLCIVAGTARQERRSVLAARPLVVLGEASYALYILQAPVWMMLESVAGPASSVARLGAYVAVLVAVSVLAWRYVEQPAKRWIEQLPMPAVVAGRARDGTAPSA